MKDVKKTGSIVATTGGKPLEEFKVDFVKVGGEDGTADTQATWKYKVLRYGMTEVIHAGLDPGQSPHKFHRQNIGSVKPGDFGKAFYDYQGNLIVMWINESINFSLCNEEGE